MTYMKPATAFCTIIVALAVPGVAQQQIPISSVTGLQDDLDILVPMGPGYAPSRAAVINAGGSLDGATGNPGDCIHVDGSSGPCGGASVIGETAAGAINGVNRTFTLASTPTTTQVVQAFVNGVLMTAGQDYTLSGNTLTFGVASVPNSGDFVRVYYTPAQQARSVRIDNPYESDVRRITREALGSEAPTLPRPQRRSDVVEDPVPADGRATAPGKPFRSLRILDRMINERQHLGESQPDGTWNTSNLASRLGSHYDEKRIRADARDLRALDDGPSDALSSDTPSYRGIENRATTRFNATDLPLRSIRQLKQRLGNALGLPSESSR